METTTISLKERRQRKFLLVLPLIVLPFITLLFWSFGGGKVNAAEAQVSSQQGFNTRLPDAKLKDEHSLNKMSYYDKVASDSVRLKQQMKTDPYYSKPNNADTSGPYSAVQSNFAWNNAIPRRVSKGLNSGEVPEATEARVYQRLTQLQAAIDKPVLQPEKSPKPNPGVASPPLAVTSDLKIETLQDTDDPELKQMNGVLERILDIQHPERLKVKTEPEIKESGNKRFEAIPAVIEGKQKITQGTVVRLRLLDSVTLGGQLIPKGQLLYGSGNLYNQRMIISIKSIHVGNAILPVDLTVFDQTDGLEGICVPEAITDEAVKEGAVNGVQGMELMSLDQSVSTQLASAGITAAKGLFSKKVRRVKAKLKDGHPLLLRDNNRLKFK
ncbi:MAG: conjugative transposon TraM protein [Mucilaginibacter sp.]|nr:conjugative transposon TraM protein [Mucilaginibacter sp.]